MMALRVLDLFCGAVGGWSAGLHDTGGFITVAACEADAWRRGRFSANNPGIPIYDDVRTLTADRLAADGIAVDVIVGSPPCQDISSANARGKGVDGTRSGLFFEATRIIGEIRPRWVGLENSPNLRSRGADRVLAELERCGYACWPFVVGAVHAGANHWRKRAWIIAHSAEARRSPGLSAPASPVWDEARRGEPERHGGFPGRERWVPEPGIPRQYDGVPNRLDLQAIEAFGDAVVRQNAAMIGRAILAAEEVAA